MFTTKYYCLGWEAFMSEEPQWCVLNFDNGIIITENWWYDVNAAGPEVQ